MTEIKQKYFVVPCIVCEKAFITDDVNLLDGCPTWCSKACHDEWKAEQQRIALEKGVVWK